MLGAVEYTVLWGELVFNGVVDGVSNRLEPLWRFFRYLRSCFGTSRGVYHDRGA